MYLTFGGSCADSGVAQEVSDKLWDDGIEKFRRGGYGDTLDVELHPPRLSQAFVDLITVVNERVGDESLPAQYGARFLKIDAHDYEQFRGVFSGRRGKARGVFHSGLRVVDRARAYDDQQAIVAPVHNVTDLFSGGGNLFGPGLLQMQLLKEYGRRYKRAAVADTGVIGNGVGHGLGKDAEGHEGNRFPSQGEQLRPCFQRNF